MPSQQRFEATTEKSVARKSKKDPVIHQNASAAMIKSQRKAKQCKKNDQTKKSLLGVQHVKP